MPLTLDPVIEEDLGSNPGRVRFETLEELDEWARAETGAWDSFYEKMRGGAFPQAMYDAHKKPINRLINHINSAKQQHGQGQPWLENLLSNARNELAYYKNRSGYPFRPQCLHFKSPAGRRILETAERGDRIAIGMLAWEIGFQFQWGAQSGPFDALPIIDGYILAHLQEAGFSDTLVSERAALHEISADWTSRVSEQRAFYQGELQRAAEVAGRQEHRFKSIASAALKVLREQRNQHRAEMATIRSTFREEMRLRAPVDYWTSKKWWSFFGSAAFALIFVLLGALALWFVFYEALPSIDNLITSAAQAEAGKSSGPTVYLTHLRILVFVGVPAFIGFWILRVISRLFHMNIVSIADASERVTMVKTYLALYDDKKLEGADRILILQALFRPTSQTPDESPPPNWFDLLMQRINPSPK